VQLLDIFIYNIFLRHLLIKKIKQKAEGAKKEKKKPHQKREKRRRKKSKKKIESGKKSEEKFRSACILLSLCAELYCSLLELGPGRV